MERSNHPAFGPPSEKIALIGSNGMLAGAVRKCAPPEYRIEAFDLPDFDITDREQVLSVLSGLSPRVIVNCAAFTAVDACETSEDLARRVNGEGPGHLAEAAREIGATLVHISTDYVFDGRRRTPYREDDPPAPRSAYGRSKLLGEQRIIESGLERFFIVRTSWLYGPGGRNFVETIVRLGKEREELRVVADQVGGPTLTHDLAKAIFRLLALPVPGPGAAAHAPYGIYHFANEGECSWHEFACAILAGASEAGEEIIARQVVPIATADYPLPAPRPAFSVFSKEKYKRATGAPIPGWRDALRRYFAHRCA